jgi:hypothetical protein
MPGFQAQFVRNDLLVDGVPSMARFFEILEEDGCRGIGGGEEDVIVRDECGIRLQSSRHLNVAFQKLANEEKLASKWYVLRKGDMNGTLAQSTAIAPASLLGQWGGQTAMSEYFSGEENVSYSAFESGAFGAPAADDVVMEDQCQQHPPPPSSPPPREIPVASEGPAARVQEVVPQLQVETTAAANDGDELPKTTALAAVENHELEFDMWADDDSSLSSAPPSPPTLA